MSGGLEHRESGEALGAYALGALPEPEAAAVRDHLAGCRECRAELDRLRAGVDLLPASVPQVTPPPELKLRVMEVVEAEAELLRAAGEAADRTEGRAPWWRRLMPAVPWVRPALALAAVGVAAVVIAVVLVATGGGPGQRTIQAQIIGPGLTGRTRASLSVSGTQAELTVRGLPAPAAGHVDELWVKRDHAPPVPAGTFVVRSGSVVVAGAVHRGDTVLVTVEPGPGSSAPTTAPLLSANV